MDSTSKPFGAHKVAHELRVAGFPTLVINHIEYFTVRELKEILAKAVDSKTLFIGVSNTFFSTTKAANSVGSQADTHSLLPHTRQEETELCNYVKTLNPDIKFIVGGARSHYHVSNPNIDYVFVGYSDHSIVNFAQHLSKGSPLLANSHKNLSGVIIVDDDLAKDFDFTNSTMQWTEDDVVLYNEVLPLEISRGCIFSCKFCSFRLNGKKALDYLKNYDTIRNELIYNYENFGITNYRFVDDTFNDTEEKIDAMLSITESLPFKLNFWAYIRIDLLITRPETIDKLHRMGLRSLFFGIETLNRKTGLTIGKGFDPQKTVAMINSLKEKYGDDLHIHASFIWGLPGEDIGSVSHTMERLMSREINADTYGYHALTINKTTVHTWQSAFGLNMQEYGYSKDTSDTTADAGVIPWKNEHMNFRQAKQLVNEFLKWTQEQGRFTSTPANQKLTQSLDQSEFAAHMKQYKTQLKKLLEKKRVQS